MGQASGISQTAAAAVKVTTAPGRVIVTIPDGTLADGMATLATPDGRTACSTPLRAPATLLRVPAGVYILTLPDGTATKLRVP